MGRSARWIAWLLHFRSSNITKVPVIFEYSFNWDGTLRRNRPSNADRELRRSPAFTVKGLKHSTDTVKGNNNAIGHYACRRHALAALRRHSSSNLPHVSLASFALAVAHIDRCVAQCHQ